MISRLLVCCSVYSSGHGAQIHLLVASEGRWEGEKDMKVKGDVGWRGRQRQTHNRSFSQYDQAKEVQSIKGIGMKIKDAVISIIIYHSLAVS